MAAWLELAPLLQTQRDLYELPLGRERFERYLATTTGGGPDMERPLSLFNPMAKPHAAEALDRLIELEAEAIAAGAISEAVERLPPAGSALRVALVLVDDLAGGWTNRYFTELGARREPMAELRRGWVTVPLWTSESAGPESIRRAVLNGAFRARFVLEYGPSPSLRALMRQEGLAAAFGGGSCGIDPAQLERWRRIIDPHRSSEHLPILLACLYGDDAARSVGYDGLGLPADAGWELALHEALDGIGPPELELTTPSSGTSIG